ncbi:MAG: hypothetical protein QOJ29_88 [Thermoleophilaceae bacterium]|nr:hypothetical protein [Thermoleophilaceae bacterium]
MEVDRITPEEVAAHAVEALGLDPEAVDLLSPEALAASIRRAASVMCPTTPLSLVRAVTDSLSPLPAFTDDHRSEIADVVGSLIAFGDLIELPLDNAGTSRRHLFLGPPAFVHLGARYFLCGVRAEGAPLLGDELMDRVEYNRHVRLVRADDREPMAELLTEEGLVELGADQWLSAPREAPANEAREWWFSRLDARPPTGDLEDIRILDPHSAVRFYRGRWRTTTFADSGNFVARRPQAYGADLWCLVSLDAGSVTRVLDLPVDDEMVSGADDAWRLQAAIDAEDGHPQEIRIRASGRADTALLDFFGPLPRWAQRRLDVMGTPTLRGTGALFSYQLGSTDLPAILGWLREMLWMAMTDERPVH